MKHKFKTKNTCANEITFDLDGDIVRNIVFTGGCSGNLQTIGKLLDGCTVAQIEEKCGGIDCDFRGTSCSAQLALAVRQAIENAAGK